MEKQLNVGERLIILQLLPKEGNFTTLRLIRDLAAKVGLSADELVEFDLKQDGSQVKWNAEGSKEKPFELKFKEIELITKELQKLDKENKLGFNHFTLFEKFSEEEDANN